jgi:uncharacterized protein GlcG (DUF336 family)
MTRLRTWVAPLVLGMLGGSATVGLLAASPARVEADDEARCTDLPGHAALSAAIKAAVDGGGNGGIANDVWIALVNRDGVVCQVTFSGVHRGAQWSAGRVLAAEKASTAVAFSLPRGSGGIDGLALSTANLYAASQPGGMLFGLESTERASDTFAGRPVTYGLPADPLVGKRTSGRATVGGGLALYDAAGALLGALGVSGDTPCTDHILAWKVRYALNLDNVPVGRSATGDDNIIHDMEPEATTGAVVSRGGYGHPTCDAAATRIAEALPGTHPVGPAL